MKMKQTKVPMRFIGGPWDGNYYDMQWPFPAEWRVPIPPAPVADPNPQPGCTNIEVAIYDLRVNRQPETGAPIDIYYLERAKWA